MRFLMITLLMFVWTTGNALNAQEAGNEVSDAQLANSMVVDSALAPQEDDDDQKKKGKKRRARKKQSDQDSDKQEDGAKGRKKQRRGNNQQGNRDFLRNADSDGNGEVSLAEALARAEALFKRLDKNNDGVLDKSELRGNNRQRSKGNKDKQKKGDKKKRKQREERSGNGGVDPIQPDDD